MPDKLPDYRLKIERARRHIGELSAEIQAFIATKPYAIVTDLDPQNGDIVYKLKIISEIPSSWSAIIGDAIHNIRASLDLLLCTVVRKCDPGRGSYKHVHFVVRDTKEKFEAAIPKNIKGASIAAIGLVHDLRPYKGGNDALWRLHSLDIMDKHQAIIPVWSRYEALNIGHAMHAQLMDTLKSNPNPNPNFPTPSFPVLDLWLKSADRSPLYDGSELLRIKPAAQTGRYDNFQARIEIAFGQSEVLEGEPVVAALSQLADYMAGVFEPFEATILR